MWFLASVIAHADGDYATVIGWLKSPFASLAMIVLLLAIFHHTALGLQMVIEDYIHSEAKFAAVGAVRLGCFALASAGIVAILRVTFSR